MFNKVGIQLARFLSKPRNGLNLRTSRAGDLAGSLQKGDVLLVEGTSRFSTSIKYLTQSSWSHSAIYVGNTIGKKNSNGEWLDLIEADVLEGVRAIPLSVYENDHTRICRPVGLSDDEIQRLLDYLIGRIGHQYDLKNVFDLARYLISTPPVPGSAKRRMLAFGSGDPTRAICSTLTAAAFQSIGYPILPDSTCKQIKNKQGEMQMKEIRHIRHHSLFAPRDFDVSPYFRIIKPTLKENFNFREVLQEKPADTTP